MATTMPTATVLHACSSVLGEGPTYDVRTGRLLHVDISGRSILSVAAPPALPAPRVDAVHPDEDIGCIALTPDPNVVLAALSRTVVPITFHPPADATTPPAAATIGPPLATLDESEGVADMRFNDGKVSPKGAFIIGRLHAKWREPGNTGAVYRLDLAAKQFVRVLTGEQCAMPNGMAWLPDGAGGFAFYIVDSAARVVRRHTTDSTHAAPDGSDGAVVVATPDATPDGMDADSAGRLWIALAEKGTVAAFDPATGARVASVTTLPLLTRVTSCGFGGQNLATLFITSREEKGEGASDVAGAVVSVDCGARGAAAPVVVAVPAGVALV